MKYSIWYRREHTSRIPECAILDKDYEYLGDIYAASRGAIYHAIKSNIDPDLVFPRNLQVGDVVSDELNEHWVWTERGLWATVMVIYDSGYRMEFDDDDE